MGRAGWLGRATTIVVAVAMVGCTTPPWEQPGWRPVPLDAAGIGWIEAGLEQVVVAGQAGDGRPLVASVARERVVPVGIAGRGRVRSLVATADVSVSLDGERDGAPAAGWYIDPFPLPPRLRRSPGEVHHVEEYLPTDPSGRPPAHLWFTEEDEGAAAVGGFLDADGTLGLRPLDWAGWHFVPGPPGLHLAADASPDDLWVGGTEGTYVVVGPVSPTPGATDRDPQVWVAGTMDDHTWQRVDLPSFPDLVTDMRGWVLDLYVAGPAGDRPVVVEAHGGPALPVPDVRLDPDDPTVLIAEVPTADGERPSLVLQTPDGAVLYRARAEGWDEVPMPPGHAQVALLTSTEDGAVTAYAVVDDTLWWRDLDPAAQPSASR